MTTATVTETAITWAATVTDVDAGAVTVHTRGRAVRVGWQHMRDAAAQADGALSSAYTAMLVAARSLAGARGLTARRWGGSLMCGPIGDASEWTRARLVADGVRGYGLSPAVVGASLRIVTLDPDEVAEEVTSRARSAALDREISGVS